MRTPKPIPPRALKVGVADPTSAWEITQATQGVPAQLSCGEIFTGKIEKPADAIRCVIISDTHSYESKQMGIKTAFAEIPNGDVLIHCGDFTNVGKLEEVAAFARWFEKLPHKRKIIIAGCTAGLELDLKSSACCARTHLTMHVWRSSHAGITTSHSMRSRCLGRDHALGMGRSPHLRR